MEKTYDFKKIESEVLHLWRSNRDKIDEAIKDTNVHSADRYTFLEGPPTANAPPGLHHIEARVFKDLVTRFKQMQGFKVSRKGGWDCHGLPVEVQVEKKLGLASKKEVVKYGIDPFIAECKKDVFTFVGDWSNITERMAFWVDLEEPYMTLATPYMESVWWALKEIYEKDLLYKGHKIVPYCGRCATPLSSHEVAQGYQDIEEISVIAKFPVVDQDFFKQKKLTKNNLPVVFLAWTTTPWTLPSNLALAVHPKVQYAFVETVDAVYVLAEELVPKYFDEDVSILGTLEGNELVGQKYVPLFDYFVDVATQSYRIIDAEYVTTADGTGIVHQAPAFGEDDNVVCKKHGIDFVNPVDDNAEFTEEVSEFKGRFVKDTDKDILSLLEKEGKIFKTFPYVHSYPFCWRCKTPLIYFAKDTWFIAVSQVKDKLLEQNETINWYPSTIKTGRFGNWLEGARDWALSRNKFWGTPLPIWICEDEECAHQEVIGSIAELKTKTGVEVDDLHISTVDPLTYDCPKCGNTMRRTTEVIDCWFDSGSAPFAQLHYPFENKELFNQLYPYDFISEGIDQTRGWFYTMLVINTILFDKSPYRNVAVAGLLCDDQGDKMSKTKGNIVAPNETFDTYGVDATRLVMTSYALGSNIRFGSSIFKESIMPFFNTLWNTQLYVRNYLERFNLTGLEKHDAKRLEDEWMISKTSSLIADVTAHLEKHEYNHAVATIMDFVNNTFSRTYIKFIRDRTAQSDLDLAYVMRHALDVVVRVLAPFSPYLSEHLYQDCLKTESDAWSVHFTSWPKIGYRNERLESEFEHALSIIQGTLACRDKAKYGVRWPLSRAVIVSEKITHLEANIVELIKSQTNLKEISFADHFDVTYTFNIDFRKLGEHFGTETGDVIPEVKKNMSMITNALQQSDTVVVGKWTLTKEMFKTEKIVPEPFVMAQFSFGEIYLDTTVTPLLEKEGFAREITRRIQNLRKTAGLEKDDDVSVCIQTEDLVSVLDAYKDDIATKVGATDILVNEPLFETQSEEVVKDKTFIISLQKN